MSCSRYLLENLRTPVYNCHKQAESDQRVRLKHTIPVQALGRHCTLSEVLEFLQGFNGKTLNDFSKVVVVIRNPFELEYSFYRHMQKSAVLEQNRNHAFLKHFANMDFKTFVERAGYHRRKHPQEKFFLLDDQVPEIVELIRFEELESDFPGAVAAYLKDGPVTPFPHANKTTYMSELQAELSPEVREMIYRKHKFMFDHGFYDVNYPACR